MMRALWLLAALPALVAGCADDPPPASSDGDGVAALAPPTEALVLEGRYRSVTPAGQPLQEEGGAIEFPVTGWTSAEATFEANIDVGLWLLPPACASPDSPCALRFDADDDGTWRIGTMQAGTWTALVRADEGAYTAVEGVYTIVLGYAET